ncbi:MAG: hypothetical protein ACKOC9_15385, partial [Alphaproteobacteria bacterium]
MRPWCFSGLKTSALKHREAGLFQPRLAAPRKINQPGETFFRADAKMRAGIAPGQGGNRAAPWCGHRHNAPARNLGDQHQPVIETGRHHFLLRMASHGGTQRLISAREFRRRLAHRPAAEEGPQHHA